MGVAVGKGGRGSQRDSIAQKRNNMCQSLELRSPPAFLKGVPTSFAAYWGGSIDKTAPFLDFYKTPLKPFDLTLR